MNTDRIPRRKPLKRLLDLAIASILFVLLLPFLVVLLVLVRLDSPGDPLFTQVRVGRFGRPYTQLLNVVFGHMSLVGPRPDIPLQAQHYSVDDRRRLLVRPGLTGIAQISGNTWLSWRERIRLDQWYVDHCSFALDLLILLNTLPVLWRGERADDDPLGIRARLFNTVPAEPVGPLADCSQTDGGLARRIVE